MDPDSPLPPAAKAGESSDRSAAPQRAEPPARLALRAARVGTWEWNISSGALLWDDLTYELFGLTAGDFLVTVEDVEAIILPADVKRMRADVQVCIDQGKDFDSEYRVVWPKDGSIHHLRSRGKVFREGAETRLLGATWDITERKLLEQQLSHERYLLETLMDYMPDKIYFKDRASHYLQVSGAMARAFGKQHPLELFGRSDADFFSVEHAEQTFKDEQRIIETGKPMLDFVEKETWPDGSVTWVSTTKLPLHNAQGETIGTFGLSRDITDRRRAEEQLARYAEELRRRNVELENDLEMARELQSALMPRRYPSFPQSVETQESALQFSHFFTASSMVSGDFFDILRLSDTSAGIFICDVMGHGVRAALVAAIVRTLLGELKATGEDPGQFMHELNRKLVAILRQADDPMFVSASYVVADLAKGELRYANAGHPDAVRILHHGPTAEAVPLNRCSRGPVLGMFETAEYGSSTSELRPADVVLQFTDGLFEVEGADGALYDQRSLMEAVSRRGNLRAGELCREVLAEVRQFSASKQFSDDVCLVAAEVNRLISV